MYVYAIDIANPIFTRRAEAGMQRMEIVNYIEGDLPALTVLEKADAISLGETLCPGFIVPGA